MHPGPVSVGLLLLAALPAAAGEARFGPYEARRIELEGFAGELDIQPADGPSVRIRFEGTEKQRADLRLELGKDGTLHIRGPSGAGGSTTVVQGNVTVFSLGGGDASVVIGGNGSARPDVEPREPSPELRIRAPRGTALDLADVAGEVTIGDLDAPLVLALLSGDARIGRVSRAELRIPGSGSISADRVDGRLLAGITGSGEIDVEAGTVDLLDVRINGAGDVRFGGTARRAAVTIRGAGSVTIARVVEEPTIEITGAGEVNIAERP